MADDASKPKTRARKLRQPAETMRERAGRTAGASSKVAARTHRHGSRVRGWRVWKPLRFIGHFIIPPYFRSSWRELRHVTWPNRRETLRLTTAVVMFSIVFGAVLAAFDYGLDKLFKQVLIR